MKTIIILVVILAFVSCGQIADKSNGAENSNTLKTKTEQKSIEISQNILGEIKKYYQKEYGAGTRVEETITDSTIEITYYNIPKVKDENNRLLISIYISKRNDKLLFDAIPILSGDLNKDNINDLVVSVHTEGGGNGANGIWWNDIFVFLNQNNKLLLISVTQDKELSGCNNGHFLALKIDNGYLIGNSSCYGREDARCCPSLNYLTKVAIQKNKLVFLSKDSIR